jgi:hypothetical protein
MRTAQEASSSSSHRGGPGLFLGQSMWSGHNGTGTGFSLNTSVYRCQYHPTNSLYLLNNLSIDVSKSQHLTASLNNTLQ